MALPKPSALAKLFEEVKEPAPELARVEEIFAPIEVASDPDWPRQGIALVTKDFIAKVAGCAFPVVANSRVRIVDKGPRNAWLTELHQGCRILLTEAVLKQHTRAD